VSAPLHTFISECSRSGKVPPGVMNDIAGPGPLHSQRKLAQRTHIDKCGVGGGAGEGAAKSARAWLQRERIVANGLAGNTETLMSLSCICKQQTISQITHLALTSDHAFVSRSEYRMAVFDCERASNAQRSTHVATARAPEDRWADMVRGAVRQNVHVAVRTRQLLP
jgi:hypothetical protein